MSFGRRTYGHVQRVRVCQLKESSSARSALFVRTVWVVGTPGQRLCVTRVDNGYATTFGVWVPRAPLPFRGYVCLAWDSAQRRNAALDEFESRCDPTSIHRDMFVVCPWVAQLRRASSGEARSALLRVKTPPFRARAPRQKGSRWSRSNGSV